MNAARTGESLASGPQWCLHGVKHFLALLFQCLVETASDGRLGSLRFALVARLWQGRGPSGGGRCGLAVFCGVRLLRLLGLYEMFRSG